MRRSKEADNEILEPTDPGDALGRLVNFFIMALIVLNVAAVALEERGVDDALSR